MSIKGRKSCGWWARVELAPSSGMCDLSGYHTFPFYAGYLRCYNHCSCHSFLFLYASLLICDHFPFSLKSAVSHLLYSDASPKQSPSRPVHIYRQYLDVLGEFCLIHHILHRPFPASWNGHTGSRNKFICFGFDLWGLTRLLTDRLCCFASLINCVRTPVYSIRPETPGASPFCTLVSRYRFANI